MKSLTVVTGILVAVGLSAATLFMPSVDTMAVAETRPISNSIQSPDRIAVFDASTFDASTYVKPSEQTLKHRLSSIEFKVTQKDGTERPFANPLHDEKRTGIYVDIVSGEPLFSSSDKYDSGTGWPSFVRPIDQGVVVEKDDFSLFGLRTEIRSAVADSHLGHVFNDGPAPTGQRYCMNSAAMRFIPLDQMVASGYGDYVERVSAKT